MVFSKHVYQVTIVCQSLTRFECLVQCDQFHPSGTNARRTSPEDWEGYGARVMNAFKILQYVLHITKK